jgi:hypothetical protein
VLTDGMAEDCSRYVGREELMAEDCSRYVGREELMRLCLPPYVRQV